MQLNIQCVLSVIQISAQVCLNQELQQTKFLRNMYEILQKLVALLCMIDDVISRNQGQNGLAAVIMCIDTTIEG